MILRSCLEQVAQSFSARWTPQVSPWQVRSWWVPFCTVLKSLKSFARLARLAKRLNVCILRQKLHSRFTNTSTSIRLVSYTFTRTSPQKIRSRRSFSSSSVVYRSKATQKATMSFSSLLGLVRPSSSSSKPLVEYSGKLAAVWHTAFSEQSHQKLFRSSISVHSYFSED